mmetsp:Transcript_34834/g.52618  ORF Transcript_34834/g.52618 Transcript_34834/m.52618 type:complete len:86 (+) Transcript_34834:147-404(+)
MRPLILAAVALLASADAFQSSQIRRAGLAFSPSRTRSSSTAITASNANEIVSCFPLMSHAYEVTDHAFVGLLSTSQIDHVVLIQV